MSERTDALPPGAFPLGYDPLVASQHLIDVEPRLVPIVTRVGPPSYVPRGGAPYDALLRAICYQQLNGKAAATIHGRVLARVSAAGEAQGPEPSGPEALLALSDDDLRGCGLSRAKTAAMQDLARKTLDGTVPSLAALAEMDDEAVVQRLVQVRGVGRWTAEMLLLFTLGRPDVWPVDDFAVRLAYARLWSRPDLTPRQLGALGEAFRPYRSAAAWYGWRMLDEPVGG